MPVLTELSTNNSVQTAVRMAGNLRLATYLVADDSFSFARSDCHRRLRAAEEVHSMSLANLDGEYCSVATMQDILIEG